MSVEVLDPQPLEDWREGVRTSMRVSAAVGAHQLCIFEQLCAPGLGAPMHLHAVEEVLEVMAGQAEVIVGDERRLVSVDQSILIPAGVRHGFVNIGARILKVRATLAAPVFEASYDNRDEISRRYIAGT